jgi:hypothetical protein
MPAISRATTLAGPALISYGGQKFWSKGDVTVKPVNDRFNIDTAHFGKVDERTSARRFEIQFEPSGRFTTALAAVLWPYGATAVGTSVFGGGTDKPLTINGRDGRQIVVHAAAITTMPQLRLSVSQTLVGPVTFTGIVKNNTDPSAAGAYLTESAVAYPGDADFAVADILTKHALATWGSAPWANFLTEGGWTVDFDLQLSPQSVDGIGVFDMTFQSLAVTAKAIPVGMTQAQLLSAVAPDAALGTSVATADNLVITGAAEGDPRITISKAAMVDAGLAYGNQTKRLTEATWIATRSITGGTADALFTIVEVPA